MINETMTIHEALSVLKTLDKRIKSRNRLTSYCAVNKHCNEKINGKSIADFKSDIRSNYESISSLIARRAAIRNALSVSNAKTKIIIGNCTYTVAEAIEMKKTGIDLKKDMLEEMSTQFNAANKALATTNGDAMQRNADTYVSSMFGGKDKVDADTINNARRAWIEANTLDMIDPLDLASEIKKPENEIDSFVSEVDSKISVSNALTTIDIEY